MFNKYNLKHPETWEEFVDICETLKKNGIQPMACGGAAQWPVTRWIVLAMTMYFFGVPGMMRRWRMVCVPGIPNVVCLLRVRF
ncbi:MAG: extracellular solute-binding protein [Clostridiaceae bacterium]|nr:extracellular solute-binding protein [Clostridiaceae bacterium]